MFVGSKSFIQNNLIFIYNINGHSAFVIAGNVHSYKPTRLTKTLMSLPLKGELQVQSLQNSFGTNILRTPFAQC